MKKMQSIRRYGSRPVKVLFRKGDLKICSKFSGEHPCRSVFPISCFATLLKSHFDMGVLL